MATHHQLNSEATSPYDIPSCWRHPGIYQLWAGDQTYIGKSRDVRYRLKRQCHKLWGQFNRARVLSMFDQDISDRDLNNAEAYWIDLLRPQLNVRSVNFK
jgi:excinuclease UvrABC nuclease subunit